MNRLAAVKTKQIGLMGRLLSLGLDLQDNSMLSAMSTELTSSCEIEGQFLDFGQVRSSIARRLGVEKIDLVPASRYVEGVVEMFLDATYNFDKPLSDDRLFGWHNVLFPTGRSGLHPIDVAKYRRGVMRVVSGTIGRERIHYEAPEPERVPEEMHRFIEWINKEDDETDLVIKAGIAHLWFVLIHPFDDGNGRITRAITEMLLARSEQCRKRFYSISSAIKLQHAQYYEILDKTGKGDGDITEWLLYFLDCFNQALSSSDSTLSSALARTRFWQSHKDTEFNERQRKIINILFDGFKGKLTASKWAKIGKCYVETAENDIHELVVKGILKVNDEEKRKPHFTLVSLPEQ